MAGAGSSASSSKQSREPTAAPPSSSAPPSAITQDTFNEYYGSLQSMALKSTRTAMGLPYDIGFHKSLSPEYTRTSDQVERRLLSLTNKILGMVDGEAGSSGSATYGKGKGKLESEEDVMDRFRALVVDSMDKLFERTDTCLDQVLGKVKPAAVAIKPTVAKPNSSKYAPTQGRLDPVLQHASHIAKPQLSFVPPVDNSDSPWLLGLKHKYHAKVPLGFTFNESEDDGDNQNPKLQSTHPYYYELTHINYPSHMFHPQSSTSPNTQPPGPHTLASKPLNVVTTPSALQQTITKLKTQKEIAVDLEWHGYRSYYGFLCLMQISTREEDWIVDLLELRKAKGGKEEIENLGEVFADPEIVKVLHGADSDIIWLQQDFNLYIVNMFDTHHASKLLEFPRHGLAHLLEMYCDYIPDKRYQQADWRIRPLPDEMVQYARSDTHFLLYIYDQLRNALIDRALSTSSASASRSASDSPPSSSGSEESETDRDKAPGPGSNRKRRSKGANFQSQPSQLLHQQRKQQHEKRETLIRQVLSRSAETCLKVYAKEPYDAEEGSGRDGWDTLARKWNKPVFMAGGVDTGSPGTMATVLGMQRNVYKAVHQWRDKISREEDESTRYVLPNHFLFLLGEKPPAEMNTLLSLFSSVPPVIKRRAKDLLEVVREVVKQSLSPSVGHRGAADKDIGVSKELEVVRVEPETPAPMVVEMKTSSKVSRSIWSYHHASSTSASAKTPGDTSVPASTHNYPQTQTRNVLVARSSSLFGPIPSSTRNVEPRSGDLKVNSSSLSHNLNQGIEGNVVMTSFKSSSSSLFGNTIRPVRDSMDVDEQAHPQGRDDIGSLFGRKKRGLLGMEPVWAAKSLNKSNTGGDDGARWEKFRNVVSRIHDTLVIVPSAASAGLIQVDSIVTKSEATTDMVTTNDASNTSNASNPAGDGVAGQIEIPFVPPTQRKTKREVVNNSIVVVGQPKQKKRKKAKLPTSELGQLQTTADADGRTMAVAGSDGDNGVVPQDDVTDGQEREMAFDFAKVPNILDDNPGLEVGVKASHQKKKGKGKGAAHFYGDFPAPPKAHSEVKSGNQSHTFRK